MRYGVMDLFNQLKENEIPMVIVSGGVKSIIDTVLEQTLSQQCPEMSY
jgi:2-hydroxy-3-keto-5-methylthiopentenyl-1-phosphate phosphatase